MKVTVVDYGRGNLFSLGQALKTVGADVELTDRADGIRNAGCIVLPGGGAFKDAMTGLRERGLIDPLKEAANQGTPLLGICVGCQMLLDVSYEFGEHEGLALIAGAVEMLPSPRADDADLIRIPNVGWHEIEPASGEPSNGEIIHRSWMYFVHYFAPRPRNAENVSATIGVNGEDVPIAVHQENVFGVQFHPEKSGTAGLDLLGRFLEAADKTKRSD